MGFEYKKTSIKIPMNLKNLIQYCIKGHTYKDEQQIYFILLKVGTYYLQFELTHS